MWASLFSLVFILTTFTASATTLSDGSIQVTALNPNLTRSFHGIAYSASGVTLPDCGATQEAVTNDVLLLAQLTPRIRTYASDCNQTLYVFEAIRQTNADLMVWIGIYLSTGTDIDTVYERQWTAIESVINEYGTKNIGGITVGNEFLLLSYGDGTATDATGVAARTTLLSYVTKAKAALSALDLNVTIPVGTSDAGSAATLALCEGVDYFQANVHPWFGSVDYSDAAAWTFNFFEEFDVEVCASASNNPTMYIAETGWPTSSDNASDATNGAGSPASIVGLQTFMDEFNCQANANNTEYFFFEFKDETWKEIYGGVEPHWGLFYPNRTLKAITIPECEVSSPLNGTVAQLVFPSSGSTAAQTSSGASPSSTSSTDASSASRSGTQLGAGLSTVLSLSMGLATLLL
ncbi:glycoside hydrolase family 17 protein [Phaffia rhodozyma]|uniref:glucan endo-1,3-beta-D-glucosidase n=1 Tax=Phaffia rhodozyma TaxID=264483 RepID=A0A0F7SGF4_PHARH|nr:glycoside hydrolase family 17 protein [Phaffia rhodozyma]